MASCITHRKTLSPSLHRVFPWYFKILSIHPNRASLFLKYIKHALTSGPLHLLSFLLMKVKEESEKAGLKQHTKTKIMASSPITSWQIDGETVRDFIFLGSKITAGGDYSHEIKRLLLLGKKAMTNLDNLLKSRDITLAAKVHLVKDGFPSSHVWMWELDHKERWAPKNWCFWTVVLEKTFESPLDCKEIQPVDPKGNQSWIFIGRTDAKVEASILWPPDARNWLIGKDPDAGKDWRQEEKGTIEERWLDASPTWWTWVWASSKNCWWTWKPSVLQSMGSQRVRHDWASELNWTDQ